MPRFSDILPRGKRSTGPSPGTGVDMDDFWKDASEIARARFAAGLIDRRTLLGALALAVAAPAGARAQAAKPREIVLANWGGDAVKAMDEAFAKPFAKDNGVPVVIDTGGPSLAKIRAMVEAKHVTWDVCDSGAGTSFTLGRMGLLEEMDYAIIDKSRIPADFALPYCTGIAGYSTIIAWDKKKLGEGPKTWAEFWDTKAFPGKRTMRKSMHAVLEAALMADGVPADKLYPLDVERALKKVAALKKDVIWWESGSQSQDLLRTGEVTAGAIWSTRAWLLTQENPAAIGYRWEGGVVHPAVWVVPKNPPAGRDWAMKLVDGTIIPERQVALLKALGTGPANPAAAPLVPPELKAHNPMDPDNLKLQVMGNEPWYADNYPKVYERFIDLITG